MSLINDFLNYYVDYIKQDKNNYQFFESNISQFNVNFSDYVKNNIMDINLSTMQSDLFQYDSNNTVLVFNPFDISPYLSIQPIVDLHSSNPIKIYNLNFNFTLKFNNTQEEYFSYLKPYEYDDDFNTFTKVLHIIYFMFDNNILNNFYQVINFCHQELYNKVSQPIMQSKTSLQEVQSPPNNTDVSNDEELEDGMKQLDEFIKKYTAELNDKYDDNVKQAMIRDREVFFSQLSNFLEKQLIGKTFKYNKLIDTLENYTPIFDAVHLDKQIYLAAHYYQNPKLTIKPILEYSYVKDKDNLSIEPMITIEFVKFEVSFLNKHKPYDNFNTVLTIIPHKLDFSFLSLLSLFTIFQCGELSLFDDTENPNNKLPILKLLPFFLAFADEIEKAFEIMRNPLKKRNLDSMFLAKNKDYNERELDKFIDY